MRALDAIKSQIAEAIRMTSLRRQSLVQELVSRGIRMTGQRRALLQILEEAEDHLDAATLLELARKRDASIDRATVYRTLSLLKELRLIEELDLMHLTGEKHFYEAKTSGDHVHLACFRCGKIEEFTSRTLRRLQSEIARQSGFEITVVRTEAGGFCRSCRKNNKVK